MKKKALIGAGVLLVGLLVFFWVSGRVGSVGSTLDTQSASLHELSETLDTLDKGLPDLIKAADEIRVKLAQFRGRMEGLRGQITNKNLDTLSMAYQHAEKSVTTSIMLMKSSRIALLSYRSALELLQENLVALRALLKETGPIDDKAKAHERLAVAVNRVGPLLDTGEQISHDLGRFVSLQETQWLDMHQQMKNLEAASQGDDELKELTHSLVKLLEIEGEPTEYVRKIHAFCENFPKKLRHELAVQNGLLEAAK